MSMSLRAGVDTVLVYAQVQPATDGDRLVSLMGREMQIEDGFRDSDSIHVIDDNKIVFLGFSSDKAGCLKVIPKFVRILEKTLKNKISIKTGISIFLEDGYSFQELFRKAEQRLHPFVTHGHGASIAENQTQSILSRVCQEPGGDYVFCTCFNNASVQKII